MKFARLCSLAATMIALLLTCSARANAQWTYFNYQIVDNTGTTLYSTTGAGFNVPGCSNITDVTGFSSLSCSGAGVPSNNGFSDFSFFALVENLIGNDLCPSEPPLPFAEYDDSSSGLYAGMSACWTSGFDAAMVVPIPVGTPKCAPGQSPQGPVECFDPFLFTATSSAVTPAGVKLVPSKWQVSFGSCLEPDGSVTCTVYPLANGDISGVFPSINLIYAPAISCVGFQAPFDTPIALQKKSNRAIPLQIQLEDQTGTPLTPTTLNAAAPIVDISFSSGSNPATDVTDDLLPAGQSSTGNQFTFNSTTNTWQYNMGTSQFTASGTYTVTVRTGDGTQYAISPSCLQTFTRP